MKRIIGAVLGALFIAMLTVAPASAHTATFAADCTGVTVHAQDYDGTKANTWSVTIAGAEQHGTFGDSFDQTFPVPQQGATSDWSAEIKAEDGSYDFVDQGTVGPCGQTPPQLKHAWFRLVSYCNTVRLEGRHGVDRFRWHSRDGHYTFKAYAKPGYVFGDGSKVKVRHAHVKRTGCGHGSGS